MKIALLGYGKMGKTIELIASQRNHETGLKISKKNQNDLTIENLKKVDVAIEFSRPEHAVDNIITCFKAGTPVVVGTTGWYDNFQFVVESCKNYKGTILYATNFSIGVNIFFELNKALAKTMQKYADYTPHVEESHHTEKLDAPSGTGITLAEGIISAYPGLKNWINEEGGTSNQLFIKSHRIKNVPGTHEIIYSSEIDDISIKHTAHNRNGFALGAVIAAEWIKDKKGVFNMSDVLNVNFS